MKFHRKIRSKKPTFLERLQNLTWKDFELKSVNFKNNVARSSVLSKLWSFPIIHQLYLFRLQLILYWKSSQFGKNELMIAQQCYKDEWTSQGHNLWSLISKQIMINCIQDWKDFESHKGHLIKKIIFGILNSSKSNKKIRLNYRVSHIEECKVNQLWGVEGSIMVFFYSA